MELNESSKTSASSDLERVIDPLNFTYLCPWVIDHLRHLNNLPDHTTSSHVSPNLKKAAQLPYRSFSERDPRRSSSRERVPLPLAPAYPFRRPFFPLSIQPRWPIYRASCTDIRIIKMDSMMEDATWSQTWRSGKMASIGVGTGKSSFGLCTGKRKDSKALGYKHLLE